MCYGQIDKKGWSVYGPVIRVKPGPPWDPLSGYEYRTPWNSDPGPDSDPLKFDLWILARCSPKEPVRASLPRTPRGKVYMRRWLYGLSKAEIQDKLQTMQWEWVLPRVNKEQGSSLQIAPVLKMKINTQKNISTKIFSL